jgi:hypothetical protein
VDGYAPFEPEKTDGRCVVDFHSVHTRVGCINVP